MQIRLIIAALPLVLIACGEPVQHTGSQPETRAAPQPRTFVEADFYWDATLEPHMDIVIRGVNMVHRDNSACSTIDPSSAYISTSRGSASDPVFFVTCGSSTNVFNVFFSKSEVESGAPMPTLVHISRSDAIQGCEDYAKLNASHPSTVSFSRVMDLAVTEHPNGRTTVNSSFTAQNALGVELKFNIQCLYDSESLLEGVISESL